MKLLASPRKRRRAAWLVGMLVVAAGLAGLVMLLPDRHEPFEAPSGRGQAPPKQEHTVKRTRRELRGPLDVAAQFVATAVARKHTGESWKLIAPTYPGVEGFTKKTWAKGTIPVQPFPVDKARWREDYSFKNEVGLQVALFPPRGSEVRATVFNIDLAAVGKGKHRRWLVENFGPAGASNITTSVAPRSAGGFPNLGPGKRTGSGRLGTGWILVPVGILGLVLLLPLGLGIAYMVRVRRAEREFSARRV
ncbi:MAG TPA: hypothetical protein VGQ68_07265 [Gaiellaceae bacterium]|nr:hypothetical protein [Gaiellaceae bacterium]